MTCLTLSWTALYGDWAFVADTATFTGHPNELCSGAVDAEFAGYAWAAGTGIPFDGSVRVRFTGHVAVSGGTDPSIFIGLQSDDETGSASGFDASSAGTNIYSWDDFDTDPWDLSTGIDFALDWNPGATSFTAVVNGTTYVQTLGTWPVAPRFPVVSANGNNCGVSVVFSDLCIIVGEDVAPFTTPAHHSVTYQPTCLVFVDGDLLDDQRIEAHTVHGFETPVGTATVVLSIPRPASVLFNKVVEIHAQIGSQSARIFQGVIRADADSVDESGMTATLNCQGWAYILAMDAIADTVWRGNAICNDVALITDPIHLGDETVSAYEEDDPSGHSVNLDFTPDADYDRVFLDYESHGTNSYSTNTRLHVSRFRLQQPVGTTIATTYMPVTPELFGDPVEWRTVSVEMAASLHSGVGARLIAESGFDATAGWDDFELRNLTLTDCKHGRIAARRVIAGVLKSYGFGLAGAPQYEIRNITDLDGNTIFLGGNNDVDAGQVRWEKGESGLAFINRIANLWGYAGYDCPDGVFRVSRALGAPTISATKTWNEGSNLITFGRARTADPIANWVEVTGASPLPDDGTQPDPYFSAPSVVDPNPLIPEPGVKYFPISDDLLVSDALCDTVRAVAELRYNSDDPATLYDWTAAGEPRLRPGKVVRLNAPSIEAVDEDIWLISISQDLTADGYWSSYTGRFDTGNDTSDDEICTTETLIAADDPQHLGDETLGYYDVNAPSGHVMHVDFTPADDFTSISLTYEAHGVNSYLIGGGNTGSDVSRFRIEQPVGTIIGSGVMPLAAENFGDPPTWQEFELPIPGALADGVLTRVFITSGNDARAVLGPYDDFEIRNLVVSTCTNGAIDDPGEPTNPPIPVPKPEPTPSVCWFEPPDVTVPPKVSYGSLTVPAGTTWVWIHGDAVGSTGDVSILGTYSAQGYAFVGAGLRRYLLVPGTATEGDADTAYRNIADVTATILVGSGPFETFWKVGSPVTGLTAPITVSGWSVSAPSGTPFSVSDVCVAFLGPSDWPY